jgi:hypothetical protein
MKVVVAELVFNDFFHFFLAEGFQLYRADFYVMRLGKISAARRP